MDAKYDSKGNLVEYTDGKTTLLFTNRYDSNGYLKEVTGINSKNHHSWTTSYEYDGKGNVIAKTVIFPGKGGYEHLSKFTLDEKDRVIETQEYYDKNLQFTKSYKYDDKGNKIEDLTLHHDSGYYYKTIFIYDDLGNEISKKYESSDPLEN